MLAAFGEDAEDPCCRDLSALLLIGFLCQGISSPHFLRENQMAALPHSPETSSIGTKFLSVRLPHRRTKRPGRAECLHIPPERGQPERLIDPSLQAASLSPAAHRRFSHLLYTAYPRLEYSPSLERLHHSADMKDKQKSALLCYPSNKTTHG